jgi:hypothetical protein
MSPLGREWMEIAAEIDASDEEPMSEDDLERELITIGSGRYCSRYCIPHLMPR